ncbi:MAG: Rha family transcriptional regulator, partial [Ghiorsea sp.]
MSNLQTATPQITIHNNIMQTTSRNVAEVFGKNHKEVLRDIQNLDIPQEFTERNFALCSYKGKNGQSYKMHNITRDGFTLLVMGFNGKKAMTFKLGYIGAFNQMETELLNTYKQAALPETITPAQQKQLHDAVTSIVIANYGKSRSERSIGFHNEWGQLKTAFKVAKYDQIALSDFPKAMKFVIGEYVSEEETQQAAIGDGQIVVNKNNHEARITLALLIDKNYGKIHQSESKLQQAQSEMS